MGNKPDHIYDIPSQVAQAKSHKCVLIIGSQNESKTSILKQIYDKGIPGQPLDFNPLLVNDIYNFKIYNYDIQRKGDTLRPITWRTVFDRIDLVVYVPNMKLILENNGLNRDLDYFAHVLNCGYFNDVDNGEANVSIRVLCYTEADVTTEKSESIANNFRDFAGKWDIGIGCKFVKNATDIVSVLHDYVLDDDAVRMAGIHTRYQRKKSSIIEMAANGKKRFNRKNSILDAIQMQSKVVPDKLKLRPKEADELIDLLTSDYDIYELDLTFNDLSSTMLKDLLLAISFNKKLQYLNLSHNVFTHEVMTYLADMVRNNTSLQKLVLINCAITDSGIVLLSKALVYNTTLKLIDISDNDFNERGGVALCNALKANKALTSVSISGNKIQQDGIVALGEVLRFNKVIKEIDCSDIGTEELDVKAWIKSIKQTPITKLERIYFSPNTMETYNEMLSALLSKKN